VSSNIHIYIQIFQIKELLYALGRRNLLKEILQQKFEMKNLLRIISKINKNKKNEKFEKFKKFNFSNNNFSETKISLLELSFLCGSKYGVQYFLTYGGGWLLDNEKMKKNRKKNDNENNYYDNEDNIYTIINNSNNNKYKSKNNDDENIQDEKKDYDIDNDNINNFINDDFMYEIFDYLVNFSGNVLHAAVIGNRVSSLIYVLKWLTNIDDNYGHIFNSYDGDYNTNYDNLLDDHINTNNNDDKYNDDNHNNNNPEFYTYPKDILNFLLRDVNDGGETPVQLAERLNRIDIKRELIKYMK
jgi:hypothetical protein